MKEDNFLQLLEESTKLELAMAELYQYFHNAFNEDLEFWWKMMIEEKGHAAILRSGEENFVPLNKFPKNLISHSLKDIRNTISNIENLIRAYEDTPPSRSEAFNTALNFEMSAGEVHFQEFIENKNNDSIDKVFQKLISEDKNHAKKLLNYMKKNKIKVEDENIYQLDNEPI